MHDEFSGDGINDDIIFQGINPDNFIEVELDIFVIDHSWNYFCRLSWWVVNCFGSAWLCPACFAESLGFQKLLSSWHETTYYITVNCGLQLWIAFKNYYLRDTKQLCWRWRNRHVCCELLSKIIIFVTRHNHPELRTAAFLVVNCFQKLLSSWHDTTNHQYCRKATQLWIAFKNYYLRDTTQLDNGKLDNSAGCELLSKIIIFVTRHNSYLKKVCWWSVVNCFQKLLSSWHDTTFLIKFHIRRMLWIAFKNYYLRDTTQHGRKIKPW